MQYDRTVGGFAVRFVQVCGPISASSSDVVLHARHRGRGGQAGVRLEPAVAAPCVDPTEQFGIPWSSQPGHGPKEAQWTK